MPGIQRRLTETHGKPVNMAKVLDTASQSERGWDVVLVDSRFRTACALKSLLATSEGDISTSVVAVHDFIGRDSTRW